MERLINYKNIRSISVHRKEIWEEKETVTRWKEPSFWKRLFTNNWKKIDKRKWHPWFNEFYDSWKPFIDGWCDDSTKRNLIIPNSEYVSKIYYKPHFSIFYVGSKFETFFFESEKEMEIELSKIREKCGSLIKIEGNV